MGLSLRFINTLKRGRSIYMIFLLLKNDNLMFSRSNIKTNYFKVYIFFLLPTSPHAGGLSRGLS